MIEFQGYNENVRNNIVNCQIVLGLCVDFTIQNKQESDFIMN